MSDYDSDKHIGGKNYADYQELGRSDKRVRDSIYSGSSGVGSGSAVSGGGFLLFLICAGFFIFILFKDDPDAVKKLSSTPQLAFNASNYYSGKVVKKHDDTTREISLLKRSNSNSFVIVTYHKDAENINLPSSEEINELFGEDITGRNVDTLAGHIPFQYTFQLLRYELPRYFSYAQLSDTGYGAYNPEYASSKEYIESWMSLHGGKHQVLNCYYANNDNNFVYAARYWYKERPASVESFAGLRKIALNHPFLSIRYPRVNCPIEFEGVIQKDGRMKK